MRAANQSLRAARLAGVKTRDSLPVAARELESVQSTIV
jgi:hypothetical protein